MNRFKSSSYATLLFVLLSMAFIQTTYAQQHKADQIKINQKQPFGQYMTDGNGMSVYLFLKDKSSKSTCYDRCAEEWPPVLTNSKQINGGSNVQSSMLGTVKRKDGSWQVTYNNHPLYYYDDDKQAGDVEGQDKKEYGAEWYLVKPNGKKMGDVKEMKNGETHNN